ncbi:fluoride efflux transporter FluC [Curtobacterium flaccumfaciens]|uniref:fluoride efflux transporter FluC n=1 Tax=Curtobacterium flaccumfaciens TaxID=2035 RepID=UPI0026596758|nr:CrcB family protein [Curtobacterium flaccumfaciens]MCX2844174.1 CrcB family protein [Curtobacterium flaccumfaciens pv. oortii]
MTPEPTLPVDSDIDVGQTRTGQPRPVHLRPRFIALVAAGGVIGTFLRAALSEAIPEVHGVPWTVFGINVVGALVLGFLLDALAHRGPDAGRRRAARLFIGTGICGGFTTYSALATDSAQLLAAGRVGTGTLYALLTVASGLVTAGLGIGIAAARRRRAPLNRGVES